MQDISNVFRTKSFTNDPGESSACSGRVTRRVATHQTPFQIAIINQIAGGKPKMEHPIFWERFCLFWVPKFLQVLDTSTLPSCL
jgi:hypothetical protein